MEKSIEAKLKYNITESVDNVLSLELKFYFSTLHNNQLCKIF